MLELIVVVGLIAALSLVFMGGLGGEKTAALPMAQATVANLLAAARTRAMADGRTVRVLVNQGSATPALPLRYLRFIILQEQADDGSAWQTVADVFLPDGVCALPASSRTPSGLLAEPADWTRVGGGPLDSSALTKLAEPAAVDTYPGDTWSLLTFTPAGLPAPAGGCVALATARAEPPGHDPPVQLLNPQNVRGVMLSRYGVPVLLNGRNDF